MGFLTTRIQHKLQCLLRLSLLFGCSALLVLPSKAQEADNCQDKTFQITATSTRSTCQSNGTITVELGEGSEDFYEFQYQILGSNGSFSYPAQRDNVLIGIPPGRHLVNVNGLCKDNNKVKKFVSIPVIVEGDYKVPEVHTVSGKMRNSYTDVASGRYAFRIDNGSGNFVCTITEAPAGFDVPWEFTPTPDGVDKIVPRNLPAGDYKLVIEDGCYTAVRTFTITGNGLAPTPCTDRLPRPRRTYTERDLMFHVHRDFAWCDSIMIWTNFDTHEIQGKNIADYEYSVTFEDEEPTQWFTLTSPIEKMFALPAGLKISDFYSGGKSLTYHQRHKDCPTNYFRSTGHHTRLHNPYIWQWNSCEDNNFGFSVGYNDAWTNICFPATLSVYDDQSQLLETLSLPHDQYHVRTNRLDRAKRYRFVIHDKNGKEVYNQNAPTYTAPSQPYFYWWDGGSYARYGCKYHPVFYVVNDGRCNVRTLWKVFRVSDGHVLTSDSNRTSNHWAGIPGGLDYDTLYRAHFIDEATGALLQSMDIRRSKPSGQSISVTPEYRYERIGNLRIHLRFNGPRPSWTQTELFEILDTEGNVLKQEYGNENRDFSSYQNPAYWTFNNYHFKNGNYTARIIRECDTLKASFVVKYPYSWNNLGHRQSYDCNGYKMHIMGNVLWNDAPDARAYYRIIAGSKSGYPTNRRGFSTPAIVEPGRYSVEIGTESTGGGPLPLDTIVANITPQPLQLDDTKTVAYACADNLSEQGYMFVKAKNGVEPYEYELWDESNTQQMPVTAQIHPDGVAEFAYGVVNDTYTIRIRDACGNNFSQRITINDLSRFSLASTPDNFVCMGEEIRLYCSAMERYEWSGPNGWTSTEQNPQLKNATRNMSGRYKIVGYPRGCGKGVTDYLDINVEPCWAPINPNLMQKVER